MSSPRFVKPPSIIQADDKTTIIIESKIHAIPKIQCTWTLNGKPIVFNNRISNGIEDLKKDEYRCFLQVKDASPEDGGSYRLVARNSNGELRASVNLKLQSNDKTSSISSGKPAFTDKPVIRKEDSSKVLFECNLKADPKPTCSWYKNDVIIENGDKYSILLNALPDNSYIVKCMVNNLSKEDGGSYRVVASNSNGQASATMNLNLQDQQGRPEFTKNINVRSFATLEGSVVVIHCQCTADPEPEFHWYFNNKEIMKSEKYQMSYLSTDQKSYACFLSINQASKQNSGAYRVVSKNSVGEHSALIDLDISSINRSLPKYGYAPKFVEKPCLDKSGDDLIMTVKYTADPQPMIQWTKDGVLLESDKFKTTSNSIDKSYTSVVTLKNYKKSDAGLYSCKAINEHGSCIGLIDLLMKEVEITKGPSIIGQPNIIYNEASKSLIISVDFECTDDFSYDWSKSNVKLTNKSKYLVTSTKSKNQENVKIEIKNYNKDSDDGIYSLTTNWPSGQNTINISVINDDNSEEIVEEEEESSSTNEKDTKTSPDKSAKPSPDKSAKPSPDKSAKPSPDKSAKPSPDKSAKPSPDKSAKPSPDKSAKPSPDKSAKPSPDKSVIQSSDKPAESEKPKILATLKSQVKNDGDSITIECPYKAAKDVSVQWLLDGKPIDDTEQYETILTKNLAKLVILDSYQQDSGIYKCKISNNDGSDEKQCKITVLAKKGKMARRKPKFKPKIKHQEKETIEAKIEEQKPLEVKQEQLAQQPIPEIIEEDKTKERLNAHLRTPSPFLGSEVTSREASPSTRRGSSTSRDSEKENSDNPPKKSAPSPKAVKLVPKQDQQDTAMPFGQTGQWPTLRKTTVAKKVPDHWVTHLTDTKVNEDDGTVTIGAVFCRANGKLRWYKNRVEIFHGQKYNFISEGNEQKLQINKLITDDSGRYICSVNDIETKAWLEVLPGKTQYDFYLQLPAKNSVFRTKPVFLECHVNSSDCPVKWFKNGRQIEANDPNYKFYMDSTRCVLRINKANRNDQAKFACTIDDGSNKTTECYLYVEEPQWRFKQKLPDKLSVKELEDIVLEVEVEDPDAECEWVHKGQFITEKDTKSGKYEIISKGTIRKLIVKNADPKDNAGIYECKTGVMSTDCNVTVQPLLRMTKVLDDIQATENESIKLNVSFNKIIPNIMWLKNNKRIFPDSRNIILADGNNHSLEIKNITKEDAGIYSVKVEQLESKANVDVREADKPPTMGEFNKSLNVPVNKPIKIEVPFKGYPPPTVTWLKDGIPLEQSDAEITNSDNSSILSIPVANDTHTGKYTVMLENNSGKVSSDIDIQVCDRPDPPQGPLRINKIHKNGCSLAWNPPEKDGGSPITGYVIEKQDIQKGQWVEVTNVPPHTLAIPVDDLVANKQYLFRVRAKNRLDLSNPLEATNAVLAKDPYDPPSSPSTLKVADVDSNYVKLVWEKPKSDGGAAIEKFIIQKKENTGEWSKCNEVSGDSLNATVNNLTENHTYDFRVIAVNKAGQSLPGCLDAPVKIEAKIKRPFITRGQLQDQTIKVGQSIELIVKYTAKPNADYEWTCNSKNLVCDDRTKIVHSDKQCQLIITNAQRSDAGLYEIKLFNSAGSDTAKANVVVLGPPSKVNKPIKVSDVTSKSAVLSWDIPNDDGGKLIHNYVIEKREANGQWKPVGNTSSTTFKVPKLKKGQLYDFRVSAENAIGVGEPQTTDESILAKDPFDVPKATDKPIVIKKDRKGIKLKWSPPSDDGGAPVQKYIVERKKGAADWEPIKEINDTSFEDKGVIANAPYEYRVIAVNEAGPGLSSPSTGVILAKPDKEAPKIDMGKVPGLEGFKEIYVNAGEPLTIDIDFVGSPENKIEWTKENNPIRDETEIVKNEENTILHIPVTKREDTGTYNINISNDLGHDESAIKVVVLDSPGACVGPLTASTGKNHATLSWDIPDDNGGSPILAYVVEKCKADSTDWDMVGETSPLDTRIIAENLVPNDLYKFRVRAKNKFGLGLPLETTDPVKIKLPFDPPSSPSSPDITNFDTDHISIAWDPPSSDGGNPISGYIVEMRDGARGEWTPCTTKPIQSEKFTANNLKPNHDYEFRVKAVNDAGPGLPSQPSNQQKAVSPINPPSAPSEVNVINVDKQSATLNWKAPENDGGDKISKYIVEMHSNDYPNWVEVASVSSKQAIIPKLAENSEVRFRVKAENSAGVGEASNPSDVITIKDPPSAPSFVDLSKLKDITVRAGQPFSTFANYTASPEPIIECFKGESPVFSDDNFTIKADSGTFSIGAKVTERSDSGIYKILLKNSEGTSSATFNLNVLDVPSKPNGPLEAHNIDHDRCTLRWDSPKDDGGSPITAFIIEKRPVGSDKWIKAAPVTNNNFVTVKNLDANQSYEFRVIAENSSGKSEPLTTSEPVKIKSPYNSPDAPGIPFCADHTENSITVSWAKPVNNGGAPIDGYFVEYKEPSESTWKRLNSTPKSSRVVTIPNLQNFHSYNVRVAAVNVAGQSPWSEVEDSITARPADVAPYIPYTNARSITVKAGEPLELEIPFTASPLPESAFTKNGLPVPEDERHLFRTEKEKAFLTIPISKLEDQGSYICTLKNDAGQADNVINVSVIDVPSKPEGPLNVSNVSPYNCLLSWSPPLNDHGSPITNYIIEKCDPATNNWEVVSKYCREPQYEVFDLEKGKNYTFRVRAENEAGLSEPLILDKPIKAQYASDKPSSPLNFRCVENNSDLVVLNWQPPLKDNGSKIQGYMVEAKHDTSDDWDTLTVDPIRNLHIDVDHLLPDKTYRFRVCAINAMGKSDYTDIDLPVKTKFTSRPPDAPHFPEVLSVGNDFVQLVWEPPRNTGIEGNVPITYRLEKKVNGSQKWEPVMANPITDSYITVHDLTPNEEIEFRVCASNPVGDSEWSEPSEKIKVTGFPNGKPPTFTRTLSDIVSNPSTSARLEVSFDGDPKPTVKWLKNGLEIVPGIKYAVQTRDQTSTLLLQDIWEIDNNTTFTCEITNPLGKTETSCKLNVRTPPHVSRTPQEVNAKVGNPINTTMQIEGSRDLKITIEKITGDQQLSENCTDKFKIQDDQLKTVTISMKEASIADNGEYIVRIENEAGETTTHMTLNIQGKPDKPSGPLEPFDINKTSCKLTWKHPANDGNDRVSHYIIEKHDLNHPADQWIEVDKHCKDTTLTVDKLIPEHEYEFRVKAVNRNGESSPLYTTSTIKASLPFGPPKCTQPPNVAEIGSNYVKLNWSKAMDDSDQSTSYYVEKKLKNSNNWICVSGPLTSTHFEVSHLNENEEYEFRIVPENDSGKGEPSPSTDAVFICDSKAIKPPTILSKLNDLSVNEGCSGKFEVVLEDSINIDEIIWMKESQELHSGSDFTITRVGNVCSLVINNAKSEFNDEIFTFKVKNAMGIKTSRAKLNVNSKPRIKVPNRLQETQHLTKADKEFIVKLPFTANPKPNATWFINGQPLSESKDNVKMTLTDRYAQLHIPNINLLGQSGSIELKLDNDLGSSDAKVSYVVAGRPSEPTNLQADAVYDDCVTLSWQAPTAYTDSSISDYIIECKPADGDWKQVGVCSSTRYIVPNLEPSKEYSFRVIASNSNGKSDPSSQLDNICTNDNELRRIPDKSPLGVDKNGRPIRGIEGREPSDYDKTFHDIWKTTPANAVEFVAGSVYDKYDVYEEIGRSPFAVVHRAVEKSTGKNYALKFVETPDDGDLHFLQKEIDMSSSLINPNILNMRERYHNGDETVLVYEMLTGDTLSDHLSNTNRMTEPDAINIVRQVCNAVRELHDNHIAHLDLKPESFVNSTKHNPQYLKLIDLSLANKVMPNEEVHVSLASTEFAAPEIHNREPVGYATDMWAVGALTYALFTGEGPLSGDGISKDVELPDRIPLSEEGRDFIRNLLKKDKGQRMDIYKALDHPWLRNTYTADKSLKPDYEKLNERARNKYKKFAGDDYREPKLGIGQSAWYNRRIRREPRKYNIYSTTFDRREYIPRIYIFKHDTYALEGDTAEITARVISIGDVKTDWSNISIGRAFRKTRGNLHTLEIRKCKIEDDGTYTFKASNDYGERTVDIKLHVERLKEQVPFIKQPSVERNRTSYPLIDIWQEPNKMPFFTHTLRTRLVQESCEVKLTCVVTGRPTPKISWYKDNSLISDNSKYMITNNHGSIALQMSRAKHCDAGVYRCRAENCKGAAETSCSLLVQGSRLKSQVTEFSQQSTRRVTFEEHSESSFRSETETITRRSSRKRSTISYPPSINEELNSVTVYTGSVLQLRSNIVGKPKPNITWLRNGQTIAENERISLSYEDNVAKLTVKSATAMDAGDYEVVAKNDDGQIASKAFVQVKNLSSDKSLIEHQESFFESKDVSIEQRESFLESKDVSIEQRESLLESKDVSIEHRESLLESKDVSIEQRESLLESKDVSIEHRESLLESKDVSIELDEKGKQVIKIINHLNSQIIRNGGSLRLDCELSSSENVEIEWTRNERIIPNIPDFVKSQIANKYSLVVNEMFTEDSGIFGVNVKDQNGKIICRSLCTVVVIEDEEEPIITKFLCSQNAKLNSKVEFVTTTNFPCQAEWSFEGQPISNLPAVCESRHDLSHQLMIPNATLDLQGSYSVLLTKEDTQIEQTVYLNLEN